MKILKQSTLTKKQISILLAAVLLLIGVAVYAVQRQKDSATTSVHSSTAAKPVSKDEAGTSETNGTPSPPVSSEVGGPVARPGSSAGYPLHENIIATVFWAGEGADGSNDYIHNRASAWVSDWMGAYGGIDDPEDRCSYRPCGFTPKENPFYFALPYNDYTEKGVRTEAELRKIPWYTGSVPENASILKNKWIEVQHGNKVAYAQWEDVGPFGEDDAAYVFGSARPAEPRAGLDLSPSLADYLGVDGRATVNWRFVESSSVPQGEWTKIVTKSQLSD